MKKDIEIIEGIRLVVEQMHTLADSLQSLTNIVMSCQDVQDNEKILKTKVSSKVVKAKKNVDREYSLEDVRSVLAKKSQKGLTEKVKELLLQFGGSRLSDIDPSHCEAIIKEAEALGDE